MISTAAQRTTSPSPVLWQPKSTQTLSQQTDNNDTATVSQPSSEESVPSGMPSTEALLASNKVEIKRTTISTALNYQNWSLEIEGNQLFLQIKGQARKVVKTGNLEELQAIKQLFKPKDSDGENGNCGMLAGLQEMMLTGHHLAKLIGAVGYNTDDQSWRMTYYGKDDKPKVYTLPKEVFSAMPPPMSSKKFAKPSKTPIMTPKEMDKKMAELNEKLVELEKNQAILDAKPTLQAKESFKIAFSKTHQPLNELIDRTLREYVYDNNLNEAEKKSRTPNDPKNLKGSTVGLLQGALDKSIRKTRKNIASFQGKLMDSSVAEIKKEPWRNEPLSLKQLAQLRRENPDTTITVGITPRKRDKEGNIMKTSSGEDVIDIALEQKLKEKGLLSNHAYTLLAVDEKEGKVTIVDPHDSSEAIVLDATALFFQLAVVANNATDKNPIATTPAQEETA